MPYPCSPPPRAPPPATALPHPPAEGTAAPRRRLAAAPTVAIPLAIPRRRRLREQLFRHSVVRRLPVAQRLRDLPWIFTGRGWPPPLCRGDGRREEWRSAPGTGTGRRVGCGSRLAPPARSAPPPAMTSLARRRSAVEGGCGCGPRLVAPLLHPLDLCRRRPRCPLPSSIRRGGSRAERHLEGRRRGDGGQEQERRGGESERRGEGEREKGGL
jgi:hypothetical protein